MEHCSSTHPHPEVVWGVWLEPGPVKVRASCVALVRRTSKRDKTGQCYMSIVIGDGVPINVSMRECGLLSIGEREWVGKGSRMCTSL